LENWRDHGTLARHFVAVERPRARKIIHRVALFSRYSSFLRGQIQPCTNSLGNRTKVPMTDRIQSGVQGSLYPDETDTMSMMSLGEERE
jgi:hypothetical protein